VTSYQIFAARNPDLFAASCQCSPKNIVLSSNLVKILQITAVLACSAAAFGAAEPNLLDTMNQELQRNYQALKQKGDTRLLHGL